MQLYFLNALSGVNSNLPEDGNLVKSPDFVLILK